MSRPRYRGVALTLVAFVLSGCAVGPDFLAPATPELSGYVKERLPARTASTDLPRQGASQHFVNGRDIPAEWWRLFRSRPLDSLIRKAIAANPNLQSTIAALRVANEMVYAQQGKYFPLVQANFNPTTGQSAAAVSSPLAVPPAGVSTYTLLTAQLLVTYTIDVWGSNRRSVESLQALADYQRFQIEAAYLTLVSNVVVAAVQEAALRGQIDATNQLISINSKMLDLLRRQFMEGYANRNDVALQEAALAQTRATLPPLQKALEQNRDLLSALAGRFPSREPPETFKLAELRLPVDLPLSVPAELVRQRPDVRSAEEQLHSASALIGVAVANMLPNLSISGARGYSSVDASTLFTGPAIFWAVAGNATQPLFDGFNLLHLERAARAAYEEAAWNYRTAVITAFQNVADALRAVQNDAEALKAANEFEKAAKVSLDLAQQQMQTGYANFLYLLTAQITYEQALLQVVQAEANRLSDTAALFQALGGGWWNRSGPPAPEQKFDVATQSYEAVKAPGDPATAFLRLIGIGEPSR